jgi:TetR/AcrR family transcriptional regulator
VQRIADTAGVNKQLLFYYFGSKAGLYRSVMQGASRRLAAPAVVADTRATRQLREELRSIYEELSENPHLIRLMAHDAWTEGLARELAADLMANVRRRVSEIVARGQGLGYFRDDADPDSIGDQALSLILGHLCIVAANQAPANDTPLGSPAGTVDAISDLLLRALEW